MKFSKQKRTEIFNKLHTQNFDIVYTKYGIYEVVSMFIACLNNYKCALITEHDFFSDEDIFVNTNSELLDLIASKFPSYLIQDEHLELTNQFVIINKIKKAVGCNIADKDICKYEKLLITDLFNAVSIKDIRKINLQKLMFNMMKMCVDKGAVVINNTRAKESNKGLFISHENKMICINTKNVYDDDKAQLSTKYTFRISRDDFRLKRGITFTRENDTIEIIRNYNYLVVVVDTNNTDMSEIKTKTINAINSILDIENICPKTDTGNIKAFKHAGSITKIVNYATEYLNKILNINKLATNINSINTNFSNLSETYQLVIYCEEKYNEAKQLGVEPMYFKGLFYSYLNDIDIITEKAYDLYGTGIKGNDLFLYAEIYYLVNYQYVSSMDEYNNRKADTPYRNENIDCEKVISEFVDYTCS